MKILTKKYKKLIKYYNKELLKLHKFNFNNIENNLDYFITYLRYMRDLYILSAPLEEDISKNIKILSICEAINEYESYTDCIEKYFTFEAAEVLRKDTTISDEEAAVKFQKEKQEHWNKFWDIINLYIDSWFDIHDYQN